MSGGVSNVWRAALPAFLTFAGALVLIGLFVAIAGKDPVAAAGVFFERSVGQWNGLSEVLVRAIPLTLCGLGIAFAFRARLFNVGADGQLIVGAILAVWVALLLPDLSPWLLMPLFLIVSGVGGAAWGGIAGWLRARYNASEIIVTIMLNYIALQLLSWAIRGPLQESMKVFPRSDAVPDGILLETIATGTRLHGGALIAIVATIAAFLVLRYSVFGYQLLAVGSSRPAARVGGIADGRTMVLSMVASGAFAGLAGGVEILGIHGRLQDDFAGGVGITAIAVALLARLNPLGVPFAALLFGVISVGSGALQRDMGIPLPLIYIIEGLVIVAFLISGHFAARRRTAAA